MKIFLVGFMGSGKTTVGKLLAHKLGYKFIDLDHEISQTEGKSIPEIFSADGEEDFRRLEAVSLGRLIAVEDTVVATGGGTPCYFTNMEIMNREGVTVYLKYSIARLTERLKESSNRPVLQAAPGNSLEEKIEFLMEDREDFYRQSHYIIAVKDHSAAEVADEIINLLGEKLKKKLVNQEE